MSGLELDIVLDSDLGDQTELNLDEIYMILLGAEDFAEQVSSDKVANCFAVSDPFGQRRRRFLLKSEIAFEKFAYVLADQQLVEILQIGQPIEKENAFNQLVGVFHLSNRLGVFVGSELAHAPMPEHAGMQEVLIDRGQLVFKNRVQMLQNNRIATYGRLPKNVGVDISGRYGLVARAASQMVKLLPLHQLVDAGFRRPVATIV